MNDMTDIIHDMLTIQERASYRLGMADKLAGIITDLLNEHEPLLKATRDGTDITVAEKGGALAFSIAVEPEIARQQRRKQA